MGTNDKNARRLLIGKERGIYYEVFGEDSTPTVEPVTKPPVVKKNPVYQRKLFDEASYWDQIKSTMFTTDKEKKDQRRFNRYRKSKQGQAALERARSAHLANEDLKHSQALLKEAFSALLEKMKNQEPFQVPTVKNVFIPEIKKPQQVITPIKRKTDEEWLQIAKQYGFSSLLDVKDWQKANGLVDDGKFGNKSRAFFEQNRWGKYVKSGTPPALVSKGTLHEISPEMDFTGMEMIYPWQESHKSVADDKFGKNSLAKYQTIAKAVKDETEPVLETPLLTVDDYKNSKYFRGVRGMRDDASVTIDGKQYPIFVILNRYTGSGKSKEENDRIYAVDPETGKMRRVFENWIGIPHNAWSTDLGGEDWFYPSFMVGSEYEWNKANPMPSMRGPLGGGFTPEYKAWLEKYKAAKAAGFKKQGGTMNKINYFQQGGATQATQSDAFMKAVLQGDPQAAQQLVLLANEGNKYAVQLIETILKEAQNGNTKVTKAAQTITQLLQRGATSAKWGAKLSYIRSLKYANGGKACPTCQAGAPIKPVKKVEEKACGGKAKKAKKRYFGGWL